MKGIPYTQKYVLELNLVIGSQIAITNVLNLAVQQGIAIQYKKLWQISSLIPRLVGGGEKRTWYTLFVHARLSRDQDIFRARQCTATSWMGMPQIVYVAGRQSSEYQSFVGSSSETLETTADQVVDCCSVLSLIKVSVDQLATGNTSSSQAAHFVHRRAAVFV